MHTMNPNLMLRTATIVIRIVLLVAAIAPVATAQLVVSPSRIVLSPATRSGDIDVKNPMQKPIVITVKLMYGVMNTDSTGRSKMDTMQSTDGSRRISVEWTKAFPKQFTLEPGESRLIKVLAK